MPPSYLLFAKKLINSILFGAVPGLGTLIVFSLKM
jgi:hypothetical protein